LLCSSVKQRKLVSLIGEKRRGVPVARKKKIDIKKDLVVTFFE